MLVLKINPISVNSFVRSINGNSPGRTLKKKSFKPDTVPDVNFSGLEIIIKIITKTISVKVVSIKFLEKIFFFRF